MKRISIALAFLVHRAAAVSSTIPPPEIYVDPLREWKDDKTASEFSATEMIEVDSTKIIGDFLADEVPPAPFSALLLAADYVAMDGGMQMETSSGSDSVGWMDEGGWVAYNVTLPSAGEYEVKMNVASPAGKGAFELVNMETNEVYGSFDSIPVTGDYEKWSNITVDANLPAGEIKLQVRSLEYGWNMQWISLITISVEAPSPPVFAPTPVGPPILIPWPAPSTGAPSSVPSSAPTKNQKAKKGRSSKAPINFPTKSPTRSPTKPRTRSPTKSSIETPTEAEKLSKDATKEKDPKPAKAPTSDPTKSLVKAPTDAPIQAHTKDSPVTASQPISTPEPSVLKGNSVELFSVKFDASDFSLKEGVELDVKMMDAGNWVAYPVQLPVNGRYAVKMRISSPKGRGAFEMMNYETQEIFATYEDLPATGNWMTWRTVTQFVDLPGGAFDLQIVALKPGWSLLWLSIEEMPAFAESEADPTGFVRAHENMIVDPAGYEIHIKGMSVGGWMVIEPHMMLAGDVATSPNEYHHMLKGVVGEEKHAEFKENWLNNFVSQQDIQELKSVGFNLVRVPMHYELFTPSIQNEPISGLTSWVGTGFQLLDNLLTWCAEEEMYVMLDLQAAPGGQSKDGSITDYNNSLPSLWESQDNQYKTLVLWQALAYRYSENPWIAGYELLSSVDWTFSNNTDVTCDEGDNAALKSFYEQAIDAIRAVDQNHMIVIDGNCGGNHHSGLWPMDDDNVALGFQDERETNFTDQLLLFVNASTTYNVPLFFKPGAYEDSWNAEAVKLLEYAKVSWSWWTWKKMESTASAFSISTTDLYDGLLDYLLESTAGDNITSYDKEDGIMALMDIANNTQLSQCTRNPMFLGSLMNAPGCDDATAIYVDPTQPARVGSKDYCIMKQFGLTSEDEWSSQGDSVSYKVEVVSPGTYEFLFKVSSMDGSGGLEILSNGVSLARIDTLPLTTRRDEWAYVYANVPLVEGTQQIEIVSTNEGWSMEWFEIHVVNL